MSPTTHLDVATRKGLFLLQRAADGNWRIDGTAFLAESVTMVLRDGRDGLLYAALRHGHFGVKFQRSSDGGAHWEECATPLYPDKPEESDETTPWSLDQIWALEAGGVDQPGRLWAGTLPGGLFRSDDRGDSWHLVRSLWDRPERANWFGGGYDHPGIHSICVDPRDSDRVLVAVSCGGVWQTEDGGDNWRLTSEGMFAEYMPPERRHDPTIQDPHRVVRCAGDPDHLWASHHNGVFRSTDGGNSWSEVPNVAPSVFGFATAVAPNDPATAWFVPAVKDEHRIPVAGQVVVARTGDGGESFEVLRAGLPQEHGYDLVFRHALDVASDGEELVMGSTTGNLWSSQDRGESWQAISHHLPPIYAARFS